MKKTKIVIDVELDDNHVPEKMFWKAEDGGIKRQETILLRICLSLLCT